MSQTIAPICRKLSNLEAIIDRLLSSNGRPLRVIERKLEQMEDLLASIEDADYRREAALWRSKILQLYDRFADSDVRPFDDEESEHGDDQISRHSFTRDTDRHDPAEGQIATLVAIVEGLLQVKPSPDLLVREKLSEMEQLISSLEDQRIADAWRGKIAQLWAAFSLEDGSFSSIANNSFQNMFTDGNTNLATDEGIFTDEPPEHTELSNDSRHILNEITDKFSELPSVPPTRISSTTLACPIELASLVNLVGVMYEDSVNGEFGSDPNLDGDIVAIALAKIPPSNQEQFSELYPERALKDLWKYLKNWQMIRSNFELSRLIAASNSTKSETQDEVKEKDDKGQVEEKVPADGEGEIEDEEDSSTSNESSSTIYIEDDEEEVDYEDEIKYGDQEGAGEEEIEDEEELDSEYFDDDIYFEESTPGGRRLPTDLFQHTPAP